MRCSPGVKHGNRAMVVAVHNSQKPKESAVELAIAALEGSLNTLDMDTRDMDFTPTSLDLPQPVKPVNRHAPEAGATRGGTKGWP